MPSFAREPAIRYHFIGHIDFRCDAFERPGAASALERALADTCILNGWTAHAFVFLPHRYQLAVEVPMAAEPRGALSLLETLVALSLYGVQRQPPSRVLQQKARRIDDAATFAMLVDQIHLEPVRANAIPAAQLATFGASSLRLLLQTPRPPWLACDELLRLHELPDSTAGWSNYIARLMQAVAAPEPVAPHS
jgi:hypothetical protein